MTRKTDALAAWKPRWIAVAALSLCLLGPGCADSSSAPRAVDGTLDLSGWDFGAGGNVLLEGRWAVCWGQLLEPDAECPSGWQTVGVRGLWSDDSARSPFGGKGVATYRLRILRPTGEDHLSLRAGAPWSAYRLWIDGVDRGGIGVVGPTPETSSPDPRRNRVFELPRSVSDTVLWVQIANFDFRGGGIRRPWLVGRPDAIQSQVGRGILREALMAIVGLVVGFAFLAQFALRPLESARGYFGFFAVLCGARAIHTSISDFGQLVLPWMSFAFIIRVEYLSTALAIFAGAGYIRMKVPGVIPNSAMRGIQLVSLALATIELFAPIPTVLATLPFFLVLAPLLVGLVVIYCARAWWNGVPGVATTLTAALIYLAVISHDVVRAGITDFGFGFELFPYFVVVWLLSEANELMRRFNRTFERVESLTNELTEANFELQETEAAVVRFVPVDFLRMLGKRSIREIESGDHVRSLMSVVHCELHTLPVIGGQTSAEDTFRLLNELIERLEPRIAHRDGFVNHYGGDGLQVLFPAGADDAVAAAIEIRELVREFNREGAEFGRAEVTVGIGVDTGPLLVGTLGRGQRLSSSVVGEAVDEARQIAALAHANDAKLLITNRTRYFLADASADSLDEIEPIALQAGSETVRLYEVPDTYGDDKGEGNPGGRSR